MRVAADDLRDRGENDPMLDLASNNTALLGTQLTIEAAGRAVLNPACWSRERWANRSKISPAGAAFDTTVDPLAAAGTGHRASRVAPAPTSSSELGEGPKLLVRVLWRCQSIGRLHVLTNASVVVVLTFKSGQWR